MSDQFAQGQQVPEGSVASDSPEQQTEQPVQQSQVLPGVQARINELTAKFREQERKVMEAQASNQYLQEQNQQLMQALLQRQQEVKATQPDPLAQLPEETRQVFDAVLSPLKQQLEEQKRMLEQARLATGAQAEMMQLDALLANQKAPPQLAMMAKQQLMTFRQRGLDPRTASVQDALRLAWGDYAMQLANNGGQPPAPQYQQPQYQQAPQYGYQSQPPPPMYGHGAPPPVQQSRAKPLPQNFEELSPDEQLALLDANGVGDVPF